MDSCGFKVIYGGGEISRHCVELVLSRFHYSIKKYDRGGKIFIPSSIYMMYLLTAVGLSPGGSITVHIYTQTIHRTTQITTNLEECGLGPVFASFTRAFALQLRGKKK